MKVQIEGVSDFKPWGLDTLEKRLYGESHKILTAMQSDFRKTIRTWKHKLDFILNPLSPHGKDLEGSVGTDDKIYMYVSRGTPPHPIRAKNKPSLAFQVKYRAKTIKRRLGSNAGGKYGAWRKTKEVRHPGTDAREFEESIQDKYQDIAENRLQAVIESVFGVK